MSLAGVLGAVVGAVIGGPMGALQGYSLGSAIDSALNPPTITGPRLEDLRIQMSTYGAPIPFEWGTNRHAGSIIWPKQLIAVEHEHSESSKGGPNSITFTYTLSCAVLICEGPIYKVLRIWANKKIVYDVSPGNTGATQDPKIGRIRFHLGTETQAVDPLIEATDGESPAYLGYAYVVFEDYDVTNLHGRPPQWEFEVVTTGNSTPRPPPLYIGEIDAVPNFRPAFTTVDPYTRWVWTVQPNLSTNAVNVTVLSDSGKTVIASFPLTVTAVGGFTITSIAYVGNKQIWILLRDFPSGASIRRAHIAIFDTGMVHMDGSFLAAPTFVNSQYLMRPPGPEPVLAWVAAIYNMIDPSFMAYDEVRDVVWMAFNLTSAVSTRIVTVNPSLKDYTGHVDTVAPMGTVSDICFGSDTTALYGVSGGANPNLLIVTNPGLAIIHSFNVSAPVVGKAITYDPVRNLYIVINSAGFGYSIVNPETGVLTTHTVVNAVGADTVPAPNPFGLAAAIYMPSLDRYVFAGNSSGIYGSTLWVVDPVTNTSEYTYTYEAGASNLLINPLILPQTENEGEYLLSFDQTHMKRLYIFGRFERGPVLLSDIVTDICGRAELSPSDIDVTQLTDLVDGYIVPRQMTGRAAIEPLQSAFYFDAVESDDKIKFIKRGASSIVTIAQDDRAAHEHGQALPDALSIVQAFEFELPFHCDVEYPDINADHLTGNQYDRRITKETKHKLNLQLPIVMTADKAKEIARVSLYQAWMNQTYRWSTSRKYAKYEPTDVVTLPTDTATYIAVITSKREHPNGIIEWEGRLTGLEVYAQSGSDSTPINHETQEIVLADFTVTVLLDIPLLRDEDNDAGFYVAMGAAV